MADPITFALCVEAFFEIKAFFSAAKGVLDWASLHAKLNNAKQKYAALEASRSPNPPKDGKYPAPWKSDGTFDMRRKPCPGSFPAPLHLLFAARCRNVGAHPH